MRDVSGSDVTPAAVKVSTCAPSVAGGGVRTRGGAFWGSLERPCMSACGGCTSHARARWAGGEKTNCKGKKKKEISKFISFFLMQVISL